MLRGSGVEGRGGVLGTPYIEFEAVCNSATLNFAQCGTQTVGVIVGSCELSHRHRSDTANLWRSTTTSCVASGNSVSYRNRFELKGSSRLRMMAFFKRLLCA